MYEQKRTFAKDKQHHMKDKKNYSMSLSPNIELSITIWDIPIIHEVHGAQTPVRGKVERGTDVVLLAMLREQPHSSKPMFTHFVVNEARLLSDDTMTWENMTQDGGPMLFQLSEKIPRRGDCQAMVTIPILGLPPLYPVGRSSTPRHAARRDGRAAAYKGRSHKNLGSGISK